jgi:hypothetical protein
VNETAWDLGFLAFGALLVVAGWLLARSETPRSREYETASGGDSRDDPYPDR